MLLSSTVFFLSHLLAASPRHVVAFETPLAARVAAAPAIAGRVLNEFGAPLPGVVVAVQGTPQATSTNAAGDFLLSLTELKTVLLFKCQGYRDQTLAVSAGNTLTVKMYALTSTRSVPASSISATDPVPTETTVTGKPEVLKFAEELPTFPGGDAAYHAYMRQNAKFPEEAQAKRASAMVFVSFVVDEQGRIIDAEVVRAGGFGFDQEALRLIRLMPWWNPGRQAGKAVRVARVLPVPFVFRERED